MKYVKIKTGRYAGFIGRQLETLGVFRVFLVQTHHQWVLVYLTTETVTPVTRWTLVRHSNTTYIEEISDA